MKILAVEDCPDFQEQIKNCLVLNGYQCKVLSSANNIVQDTEAFNPDLILMDVVLPGINGFNACSQLKSCDNTANIPLIFLTCKKEISQKVLGFKIGADDYIVKPFEPLELLARVERRLNKGMSNNKFRYGNLQLNWDNLTINIFRENEVKTIYLSGLEFKLLYYLLKNKNRILTRDQVINNVWGNDIYVTDRTVDVHISHLRKKCEEFKKYIKSIYGIGYRFDI